MKAFLMYADRDFDPQAPLPPNAAELVQDLGLEVIFDAMSGDDPFLQEVAKSAVQSSLTEPSEILYRQQILIDAMANPEVVRGLYDLVVEAIEREKHIWGWMTTKYPNELLHRSVEVMELFADMLARLRRIADEHGPRFQSTGFCRFFAMVRTELDDEYLSRVRDHLARLGFRGGVLMSADLGPENKGVDYVLRKPPDARGGWLARLQEWVSRLGEEPQEAYTYEVAERDEAGFNALSELKSEGIAPVAAALAQSTDHILSFFKMLRLELAFYAGCLNLRDRLTAKGEPICIPKPAGLGEIVLSGRGFYDPALSVSMESRVVLNDVDANGKELVIITGANRGGKSTLLRGLGLAQLMMQCGMFVPAESFRATMCSALFTHFKREEDAGMQSGKLDEELARMSSIVDRLTPHCLVLLNESFASTNEREGSEIGRQIVRALLASQIRVYYVTHMYDLAHGFFAERLASALFLRAERLADGERTFRLTEGEPLPTSFGEDLYRVVFAQPTQAATPASSGATSAT